MVGERRGQPSETGIPETLLRPEAPSRQRSRAGERRAADEEITSFQK